MKSTSFSSSIFSQSGLAYHLLLDKHPSSSQGDNIALFFVSTVPEFSSVPQEEQKHRQTDGTFSRFSLCRAISHHSSIFSAADPKSHKSVARNQALGIRWA